MMDNVITNIVENFNFNKVKDPDADKMGSNILYKMSLEKSMEKYDKSFFDYEYKTTPSRCIEIFRDIHFGRVEIVSKNLLKFKDDCSGRALLARINDDNTLTFYPKSSSLVVVIPKLERFENFTDFLQTDPWEFAGYKIACQILEIDFSGYDIILTYEKFMEYVKYLEFYSVIKIHNATFETYEDFLKVKNFKGDGNKTITVTYHSKDDTSYVRVKQ